VASPRSRAPASVSGARKEPVASFIEPCDPVLREQPPTGPGWRFEIKAAGMRQHVAHEVDAGVVEERQFRSLASDSGRIFDLRNPATKNRKNSHRQPLEIDCSRGQVGLDFHVGQSAPNRACEPVPNLGLTVKAL